MTPLLRTLLVLTTVIGGMWLMTLHERRVVTSLDAAVHREP